MSEFDERKIDEIVASGWMIFPESDTWLTVDEEDGSVAAKITQLDREITHEDKDPLIETVARVADVFTKYRFVSVPDNQESIVDAGAERSICWR